MSNAIDKEIKELLTVLGKIQVSGDEMKSACMGGGVAFPITGREF